MQFLEGVVLVVGAGLLLASLRNFYAPASTFNIRLGRIAMVYFVGMAAFSFWTWNQINRASAPVYYTLPTDPLGAHEITIKRDGVMVARKGRLVLKQDRRAAAPPLSRFQACQWTISGRPWDRENVLSEDDLFGSAREDQMTLRYEVTPETRPLLDPVELEVRCTPLAYNDLALGHYFARLFTYASIGALFLSALGVGMQRRKLRGTSPNAGKASGGPL